MYRKLIRRNQGFTLIELVIVLAIAALIILVVLQAVGSAQRANRDTTRKQEGARVVSDLAQYASNNGDTYPTAANVDTALTSYDSQLTTKYTFVAGPAYSPDAATYQADAATSCGTVTADTYKLVYSQDTSTASDFDLGVCLESGGLDMLQPSL